MVAARILLEATDVLDAAAPVKLVCPDAVIIVVEIVVAELGLWKI